MTLHRTIALALVVVLLPALVGCPTASWTGDAVDFNYRTFDGASVALASHSGRPVVLNFWNDW